MGKFVDGYIIPLPKNQIQTYRKIAKSIAKIWIKHGAIAFKEGAFSETRTKEANLQLPNIEEVKENQTLIFAYIVYDSRTHRDEVTQRVMEDPKLKEWEHLPLPVDFKRFCYGSPKSCAQ